MPRFPAGFFEAVAGEERMKDKKKRMKDKKKRIAKLMEDGVEEIQATIQVEEEMERERGETND